MEEINIKQNLISSRKWMKYMAINTAIVAGLTAISGLVMVLVLGESWTLMRVTGMLCFLMAVLCIHPTIKCFGLMKQMKSSLDSDSQNSLEKYSYCLLSTMKHIGIMSTLSLVILIVYVIFFSIINPMENNQQLTKQQIATVENAEDPYDSSNDVLDLWQGHYQITGEWYRCCSVVTNLTIEKNGKNSYVGHISVALGNNVTFEEGEGPNGAVGAFEMTRGTLNGKIRAKVIEDNKMLITLVECSSESGSIDNLFEDDGNETFKKEDQIFLITKNNDKFDAKPIGKMETYFDYDIKTEKIEPGDIYGE